jgi:uncharacterized membrane protein
LADTSFTVAAILQPVTGAVLVWLAGFPLFAGLGLILYVMTGAF